MAIEKVIEIKLSAQEAEKNLKAINKTLEEQREILILLEKELLDVQDAQNKTSKTNLAAQKQLTTQSNHLKSAIRDQKLGLKSLNIERREAADVLADLNKGSKDNTNIIRAVDKLTGGYATKIVKLKKGFLSSIKVVKGFVAGLSGIKKALIATGIGALVVSCFCAAKFVLDVLF
jgi:predicted  nucleic acid-binding Zn-ribbon protein